MSYKGVFKPQNPSKYKGNVSKIIYRSNLELRMMNFLDKHPSVIYWQSEELWVPYRSPKDKRIHRYFPDFVVESKRKDGTTITEMIEVKPYRETFQPEIKRTKGTNRVTRNCLRSLFIWGINEAKWKAAREYCLNKEWTFRLITEKDLLPNGRF